MKPLAWLHPLWFFFNIFYSDIYEYVMSHAINSYRTIYHAFMNVFVSSAVGQYDMDIPHCFFSLDWSF